MKQFILINKLQGDYNSGNPITGSDLLELAPDIKGNREEKYIDGSVPTDYFLQAEDKDKFLSVRYGDVNIIIPDGVFQNGDVIKGYAYTGHVLISSDLDYTTFPMGASAKCWGYFEIRISSTSPTNVNANAALVEGEFVMNHLYIKASDSNNIFKIEVNDAGVISAVETNLDY